jgi:hypothetical protein
MYRHLIIFGQLFEFLVLFFIFYLLFIFLAWLAFLSAFCDFFFSFSSLFGASAPKWIQGLTLTHGLLFFVVMGVAHQVS